MQSRCVYRLGTTPIGESTGAWASPPGCVNAPGATSQVAAGADVPGCSGQVDAGKKDTVSALREDTHSRSKPSAQHVSSALASGRIFFFRRLFFKLRPPELDGKPYRLEYFASQFAEQAAGMISEQKYLVEPMTP